MNPVFRSFSSIGQFRNVVQLVKGRAEYVGRDDYNEPIFDESKPKPTIRFYGTVKLDGTNAAVGFHPGGESLAWAQSRERLITPNDDNAGFARWVAEELATGEDLSGAIATILSNVYVHDNETVWLYGEWCGPGIGRGGVRQLSQKHFVIFNIITRVGEDETTERDLTAHLHNNDLLAEFNQIAKVHGEQNRVKLITQYPTWVMDVDFNSVKSLESTAADLEKLVLQVEAECPFAKAFGVEAGVGEGVVWSTLHEDPALNVRFKAKGEKHKVTKEKALVPIDPEVVAAVSEFVERTVTENRLIQGFERLPAPVQVSQLGEFLRWVTADILREEADVLSASNLEKKQVTGAINKVAREWLLKKLDRSAFGG